MTAIDDNPVTAGPATAGPATGGSATAGPGGSDPITRDIMRQLLPAIADEMASDLQRSSYNMMIYEVRDYCCALLDRDGALLCQNVGGVSHFVADLGVVIRDAIDRYGLDGFRPEDGFVTNHQRVAGQHLNNVVTYTPVFVGGELVCFAVVRAHWIDVGGLSTGFGSGPGVADPWQEGLQLDQVRLYEEGVVDEKVLRLIADNIRFPESSLGDMRAQFAACRLGEERVAELVGRYGLDTFRESVRALFADSEERCRRVVADIPDGEYRASAAIDHDFVDRDTPVEIKVRVVVEGSDMTIDLTGCSLERRGGINGRTLAAPYIAYKALTTPDEPVNEGSFRALQVDIQEGNFMMARYPAPMGSWSTALPTVVDTILSALAPALPDKIPSAHMGTLGGSIVFINTAPARGQAAVVQSVEGGGWGARPFGDGESASVSVCQGDVRNAPIETLELRAPIVVRRRELRPDSGGAGRYRGGLGLVTEVESRVPGMFTASATPRHQCLPWGLWGGLPGEDTRTFVTRRPGADPVETDVRRAATEAGGRVLLMTPGGGGWGDPLERPVGEVAADVVAGYVSVGAAARWYGVVVDEEGRVDEAGTARLRTAGASGAGPAGAGPAGAGPAGAGGAGDA